MPTSTTPLPYTTPSLPTFLKSLKNTPIETSIESLISLLKRRQILHPRQCAVATAHLLLRVVAAERNLHSHGPSGGAEKLIARIREVGRRLVAAQPRELAVGNIVRRVLGVVREVVERAEEGEEEGGSEGSVGNSMVTTPVTGEAKRRPPLPTNFSGFSPLNQGLVGPDLLPRGAYFSSLDGGSGDGGTVAARRPGLPTSMSYAGSGPQNSSLLSFLEHPLGRSPAGTPPQQANSLPSTPTKQRSIDSYRSKDSPPAEKLDIKAEVIDGIKDLLDELSVVDTQIAESALDHIHSGETILTHSSSRTVQRFLLTAAKKRVKFTVVHAEAWPNHHEATHATILNGGGGGAGADNDEGAGEERKWKPLTELGITVILIPDTAVFALMSRINKVILAPHAVLANGSLLAAAGTSTIALAAQAHRVPVVVLSGVYKLSPLYPFDTQELIEYGDPGKVVGFDEGKFRDRVDVGNPVYDFVEAGDVDLYVTNLGGCAPSFLYRIVADHYRGEDLELGGGGKVG